MKRVRNYLVIASLLLLVSGCTDSKEAKKSASSGMKCGAGKCGANMFDGNSALTRKKRNILSQMRKNDTRRECVKKAKTTKEAYSCVKDPKTEKMTLKCGAGKCGRSMKVPKPTMKCGAGKCGS